MKKQSCFLKTISFIISLVFIISLLPVTGLTAYADEDKNVIYLGADSINGPSDEWSFSCDYVYYGGQKYRVLSKGSTLLLDCDRILTTMEFDDRGNASNDYEKSTVKNWLNSDDGFPGTLTSVERNAISGDIFLLSEDQVNSLYGNFNNNARIKEGSWAWWLRSPDPYYSDSARIVHLDGNIYSAPVDEISVGVSPAFNLNLSSVLFSSLISSNPNVYKLTLKDNNLSISSNGSPTLSGNIITIPYTISGTGAQAYVMVTDSTNAVKQYTKLTEGSETGTGKFTLDSNITGTWGEDYKVYILAVNEGGEGYSDVASDLCEVSAPPEKPTEKPTEEPTKTEIPTEPPTNPEEPTGPDYPYYSIKWITKQGWAKDSAGWHYYDKNGTKLKNQWLSDNGNWYYLDSKGNMATGWLLDNGKYYFLDETSGAMKTGWLYKDGSWYFLDYWTGARHTGWVWDNYNWYYMDDQSAIMKTGWLYDSGSWYYMYLSGAMATGWVYADDAWYYFWSDGSMATGDVLIGDIWYSFDVGGAWVE